MREACLLSTHDFIRQVRDDDPVYHVVPDGSGHVLASLQAHEVEAEDLEWEAALHALKADAGADAAVLDAAEAARRKAAELDDDQRRLRDRFPETFADELPNRPAAIWPDGQDEHARLRFKDGQEPRSIKQYRLPEGVRPALAKTIEDMLSHGLIEAHDGTGVNSPVLFAPKPGTTELRFCFGRPDRPLQHSMVFGPKGALGIADALARCAAIFQHPGNPICTGGEECACRCPVSQPRPGWRVIRAPRSRQHAGCTGPRGFRGGSPSAAGDFASSRLLETARLRV